VKLRDVCLSFKLCYYLRIKLQYNLTDEDKREKLNSKSINTCGHILQKTVITQCVTRVLLSHVCSVLIKQVNFLQRSHTTAYDIRVCERVYKWGTFLIRWQTSVYLVFYAETNLFWGETFKIYQRRHAQRIYVTHTLPCARHTLDTLDIRFIC